MQKSIFYPSKLMMSTAIALLLLLIHAEHGFGQLNAFPGSGNVGIGTASPQTALDIHRNANGWLVTSKATAYETGHINGIKFLSGYLGENWKWAGVASVAENTHSNSTGLALYAGSSEKLRIASGGNVGIGTTNPTAKLAVNGNIRAKEIKVEAAPWPDYVFEEEYELPDLNELSSYIKQHKHLPGMPSAKEVEADGIDLGEMNRLLLEKVEELTLLLINRERESRKRWTAQEDENVRLRQLFEKLDLQAALPKGKSGCPTIKE